MRLKLMFLPVVLSRQCPSEDMIHQSLPLPRRGEEGLCDPLLYYGAPTAGGVSNDARPLDQARAVGARVATIAV
jgi:hypothetical protein